jgi:2-isopropylmalate synthase
MAVPHSDLIFDWNAARGAELSTGRRVLLNDETLRDGLQSPSVRDPEIEDKLEILHLMEALGIDALDLGLPGAGPRARAHVERLAREIVGQRMKIGANCAARTVEADITPIAEVTQRTGLEIAAATFLGSSQVRCFTEGWDLDFLLRTTERAVNYARSLGLPVTFVTEDTTRAHPDTIRQVYRCAVNCGARAIVVTDTVGHATPAGAANLVRFAREEIIQPAGGRIRLEWHGHRDRGLGLANCLAALAAGADCVHATALGIGERIGNAEMDLLLVNLQLLGVIDRDLSPLKRYCEKVAAAVGVPIPANYPVVGADAFRTATGVHAAAIIKAFRKNDEMLANTVYSGVPAHLFGLEQVIEIGPMSGHSNIQFWCEKRGVPFTKEVGERVFQRAKANNKILSEAEILEAIGAAR